MLIEKLEDQWICSCGNWVDHEFTWCPDCCKDRGDEMIDQIKEEQTYSKL